MKSKSTRPSLRGASLLFALVASAAPAGAEPEIQNLAHAVELELTVGLENRGNVYYSFEIGGRLGARWVVGGLLTVFESRVENLRHREVSADETLDTGGLVTAPFVRYHPISALSVQLAVGLGLYRDYVPETGSQRISDWDALHLNADLGAQLTLSYEAYRWKRASLIGRIDAVSAKTNRDGERPQILGAGLAFVVRL